MSKLPSPVYDTGPTIPANEIMLGDYVKFWFRFRGRQSYRLALVEKISTKNPDVISVRVVGLKKGCFATISVSKEVLCVYRG